MPKSTIKCEHCGEDAHYQRTQLHDIEDKTSDQHVAGVPLVKYGDHHIYRCPKCEHLTRIATN